MVAYFHSRKESFAVCIRTAVLHFLREPKGKVPWHDVVTLLQSKCGYLIISLTSGRVNSSH